MIKLSVVIPSFNGYQKLQRTLPALNRQSLLDFEVILVLDGSTDDSITYLKSFPYRFKKLNVITQRNRGRSAARNRGIAEAQATIILFLDDDIELSPDVVEKHLNFHCDVPRAVLVGTVFPNIHLFKGSFVQYLFSSYKSYIDTVAKRGISHTNLYFTSAHFSLPKNLLNDVGSFDASLSDAEDLEFASRLIDAGVTIKFDTGLIAYHNDNETLGKYVGRNRTYRLAKSLIKDPRLNPSPPMASNDTALKKKFIKLSSTLVNAEVFSIFPRKIRNRIYGSLINLLVSI